jgi:site-specific DNA recombinase
MSEIKKRAVSYCRVSTKEQVDDGNSLATQERICTEFVAKNNHELIKVFLEKGESAKTSNRTELHNLFTFCADKKNQIGMVVVYKIDRIARNTNDYNQIKIILSKYGVQIKSATEPIDDTPTGRFMENTLANVSQFDNDIRTERCVNGMRDAMREGRYTWMAPTGYSNLKIQGKSTIAPNEMAPLVLKAFKEVAKNILPLEEIRRQLIVEGLKTKSGKPLVTSHFYSMLRSPLYAGWIIKFKEKHKGLFEPIVSEELFEQVQRVLTHKKRRNLQYLRENPDFPLRRYIQLPAGQPLTGSWSKGRIKYYPYYTFKNSRLRFKKEMLENTFSNFLNKHRFDSTHIALLRRKIREHLIKANTKSQKQATQLSTYCSELKEKQSTLIEKNLKGIISDEILGRELAKIEQELLHINATLTSLPTSEVKYEELLDYISEFLRNPGNTWVKFPFGAKLKLQWFYFPKGVIYEGIKSRTTEICSLFKAKNEYLTKIFYRVHSKVQKENQVDIKGEYLFWQEVGKEIIFLSELKKEMMEEGKNL